MSGIGLEAIVEQGQSTNYVKTAAGIGVVQGRFLRGAHLEYVYCPSKESFFDAFGEVPLDGYELDFYFVCDFYDASEGNGRLFVKNVYYYEDDPADGVTASRANTAAGGLDSTCKIWFEAATRGEWAHADKRNLTVQVRESIYRAAGSGYIDIVITYNGRTVKSYNNLSWDESEDNNVRDAIPPDGDGYVIMHYDPTQTLMPYGTYNFTLGNNGFSDAGPDALAAKHWIGQKFAFGEYRNAGLYGILEYINNVSFRPTFIINQLGNEAYESDIYTGYTTFCQTYWLMHFSTPQSGLDRNEVLKWILGTAHGDLYRVVERGVARASWPWYHPSAASDKTLIIPASAGDAGRMVAEIYRSGGHVHEPFVGTDGGRGSLAMVTSKLERKTGPDDSDTLNPLGLCVIRSDLNGIYLFGSRTMTNDSRFLEASTRSYLAIILVSGWLAQSTWLIHGLNDEGQPNSPGIWARATMSGRSFMRKYAADGAFASAEMGMEDGGWMFTLGEPYTTASDILERIARARMAWKPRACAEKVILSVGVEEGMLTMSPASPA